MSWMTLRPLGGLCLASLAFAAPVTFTKDVLPILQNRCQACHRPGEIAPMSLLTYKDARPWAKAIREAVLIRRMPPWLADPRYGRFSNDHSLSQREIGTLAAWVDAGAPEGDPKDAPGPAEFVQGWRMGQPDLMLEMPNEFQVPASGAIEYQYLVIPTGFTEDKWVRIAEARPGNRRVTHHIIAFIREAGSRWMTDAKPGVPFVPHKRKSDRADQEEEKDSGPRPELLVGYAPGMEPMILKSGEAKLVKAGSDIVLQLHYTASGKPEADRSRIGLIFARERPSARVFTAAAMNTKFEIPPGDSNYKVESRITLERDTRLIDVMPHMHLRGKDFEYRLVFPTGETQTVLRVPRYDFNWQLFYYFENPPVLPKGTRIECTAHFDNSPNNPANPDPSKAVRWGDQSWEEMMIGWFDVAIDPSRDPGDYFRENQHEGRAGDRI